MKNAMTCLFIALFVLNYASCNKKESDFAGDIKYPSLMGIVEIKDFSIVMISGYRAEDRKQKALLFCAFDDGFHLISKIVLETTDWLSGDVYSDSGNFIYLNAENSILFSREIAIFRKPNIFLSELTFIHDRELITVNGPPTIGYAKYDLESFMPSAKGEGMPGTPLPINHISSLRRLHESGKGTRLRIDWAQKLGLHTE